MTASDLLRQIDTFLADTGMGPTYFGQRAVGNSKLVARLREGQSVNLETAIRVRDFIAAQRARLTGVMSEGSVAS